MNESEEKTVLTSLKLKLDKLIDRFDEQRGIIDSYVKRERDWKSSKLEYTKKIDSSILLKAIKKYQLDGNKPNPMNV